MFSSSIWLAGKPCSQARWQRCECRVLCVSERKNECMSVLEAKSAFSAPPRLQFHWDRRRAPAWVTCARQQPMKAGDAAGPALDRPGPASARPRPRPVRLRRRGAPRGEPAPPPLSEPWRAPPSLHPGPPCSQENPPGCNLVGGAGVMSLFVEICKALERELRHVLLSEARRGAGAPSSPYSSPLLIFRCKTTLSLPHSLKAYLPLSLSITKQILTLLSPLWANLGGGLLPFPARGRLRKAAFFA